MDFLKIIDEYFQTNYFKTAIPGSIEKNTNSGDIWLTICIAKFI